MSDHKLKIKKSAIKFWGLYWASLHYLSYIYPDNPSDIQKEQIYKLIETMNNNGILCAKCRHHFNIWSKNNDIKLFYNNKNDFINYFINLHNDVNKRNKKRIVDRKEVDLIYINFNDKFLMEYRLDIKKLFEENRIYELPDIINTFTRQQLLVEFGVMDFA